MKITTNKSVVNLTTTEDATIQVNTTTTKSTIDLKKRL